MMLIIKQGMRDMPNSIWLYRLYDVAEEINLNLVEQILADTRSASRVRLYRFPSQSIYFHDPPVAMVLDQVRVKLGSATFQGHFSGKVYALGVISLILKIDLPAEDYESIKELAFLLEAQGKIKSNEDSDNFNELTAPAFSSIHDSSHYSSGQLNKVEDGQVEALFFNQIGSVCEILAPALIKPSQRFFVEDYTVFFCTAWQEEWDPLPLLLGEDGPFSPQLREDTRRYSLSYSPDDLTIITWDSALVYDTAGSQDIPYLLEFAVCQLLELRYYDHRLNEEIAKMYEAIEEAQQVTPYRRYGQYRRIMKQMMELVIDINDITERIQNSLKVTGDIYYARVYRAALDAFRSKIWMESLDRKVSLIQQNYSLLNNEIVNERGALLELAIVFLIILEIVLGLLQLL